MRFNLLIYIVLFLELNPLPELSWRMIRAVKRKQHSRVFMFQVSFNDCVRKHRFVNSNISHRFCSCPTLGIQQEARNLFRFSKTYQFPIRRKSRQSSVRLSREDKAGLKKRKDNKLGNKEAEGSL